jgi:hypothetical protein
MSSIVSELDKVRAKIKKGPSDNLLMQKPFASGMYNFSMFIINYYSRVRRVLKIDFDKFMIIQTTASHKMYGLNKKKQNSYEDLESEWDTLLKYHETFLDAISEEPSKSQKNKLTISSICLVTGLPKETTRRKVMDLCSRNLLKISKRDGIILGKEYKKVFENFVPQTVLDVSKLMKKWEKAGVIKSLLNFKV